MRCLLLLLLMIKTAHAQSLPINHDARLTAGVVASFGSKAYQVDDAVSALPLVLYDNNRLYAEGGEIGIYGYKDKKHYLKAGLTYDGRQFNPKDAKDTKLSHLDKRQASVNAHVSYMYITPVGGFEVKATTDILDRSGGQTLALSHRSKFDMMDNRLIITPKIGIVWHGGDYNQYYYGVSAKEARHNVPMYTPTSSISPFVSVSAKYQLNEHFGLFGHQSVQWLSTTQKNSPLTDDHIDVGANIGVTYTF